MDITLAICRNPSMQISFADPPPSPFLPARHARASRSLRASLLVIRCAQGRAPSLPSRKITIHYSIYYSSSCTSCNICRCPCTSVAVVLFIDAGSLRTCALPPGPCAPLAPFVPAPMTGLYAPFPERRRCSSGSPHHTARDIQDCNLQFRGPDTDARATLPAPSC